MTAQEKFAAMLLAMVGTDDLAAMQIELEWQKAYDDPANFGLDDDEMQQARADYADVYTDLVI